MILYLFNIYRNEIEWITIFHCGDCCWRRFGSITAGNLSGKWRFTNSLLGRFTELRVSRQLFKLKWEKIYLEMTLWHYTNLIRLFYICSGGTPWQQTCSPGLHWNTVVNTCDYPENAKCQISTAWRSFMFLQPEVITAIIIGLRSSIISNLVHTQYIPHSSTHLYFECLI